MLKLPKTPPTTVEEAVAILLADIGADDRQTLIENKAVDYGHGLVLTPVGQLHHGLFMHLRNTWKLHDPESPIVVDTFTRYGVSMGDDVSGLIMGGFLAGLRDEVFDYQGEANKYQEHWKFMASQNLPPAS